MLNSASECGPATSRWPGTYQAESGNSSESCVNRSAYQIYDAQVSKETISRIADLPDCLPGGEGDAGLEQGTDEGQLIMKPPLTPIIRIDPGRVPMM